MYYFENIDNTSVIHRIPTKPACIQGDFIFDEVVDTDKPVVDQAISYYSETLSSSHRATDFLENRGLNDSEVISTFRLGFSDRSIGLKLNALGKGQEAVARGALQRVGLLKPSGHEFFRGALVFPFINRDGCITGAYGRRITSKLKAYSVYHLHWVTADTLFFNEQALDHGKPVILCKTPLEALTWWCAGFTQSIALMGSKAFSGTHLQSLTNSEITELYIAFGFTSDEQAAARKIARQVEKSGIHCRFIMYPAGMDANDFAQTVNNPTDAFAELMVNTFVLSSDVQSRH